ncbi:hypothetical protein ACFX2I_015752 [Malus domestica]
MTPSAIVILLLFLTFLWYLIYILTFGFRRSKHQGILPPGPTTLPIIGNLHMLGNFPYRSLQHLAKKYGPIMSIRLGFIPTIVVSSPKAAELFLKTHDSVFASRPTLEVCDYLSYGQKGMALTNYGPYWRQEGGGGVVGSSLKKAAKAGEVVDLSNKVGELVENIIYRMILGSQNDDLFDVKGIVKEIVSLIGSFNIGDYVPFLSPFDLQGLTKRAKRTRATADQLFEKIIGEHEQVAMSGQFQYHHHKDFVDVLLSLMNQPLNPNDKQAYMIDRTNVKAILVDMITGAFDTSSNAIVWSLAELLRHPRVMKHLQQELRTVIGMDQMVEENDLPRFRYLNMVVMESFRLHPAGSLLIPRESMQDNTIDGYYIPKKSRILTVEFFMYPNVWSDNVQQFYPERFINSNVDVLGHDFQLLPFGSGRRGCPGIQLGLTTVRLALANLVHRFKWDLPSDLLPEDVDMAETFGMAPSKAQHLLAVPTYRLETN